MKSAKTTVLLAMFDQLRKSGFIDPAYFKDEYNVMPKTVWRYIHDIRQYLLDNCPGERLMYSKNKRRYILISSEK